MLVSLPMLALAGRVLTLGVERIVVKKMGSRADSFCSTFLFFFLGALFLLPFAVFERIDSWGFLSRALVSGFFYSVAFVCYVRSLSLEEASLVSPLYNFNIVFLAVIAFIFLGESLTLSKGLGLALLLYGASHLNRSAAKTTSFIQSMRALLHNTGCRFMMVASLLIAVGRVIDKSNIQSASPLVYCFFLYLIISGYVFFYVLMRGRTPGILRILREQPWTAMASGAINAYSYLFLLVAITTIDVSVAEPVSMLGMVVTLLLSWLILGEDVRRRWFAVLLMLVGAWVMFV
jgi:transporter family protein